VSFVVVFGRARISELHEYGDGAPDGEVNSVSDAVAEGDDFVEIEAIDSLKEEEF